MKGGLLHEEGPKATVTTLRGLEASRASARTGGLDEADIERELVAGLRGRAANPPVGWPDAERRAMPISIRWSLGRHRA